MSAKLSLKLLGGAVALALAGVASAGTSAAGATTGTLFLNVVDLTNNTSFFFDTGKTLSTFDTNNSFSASVVDSNWNAFVAAQGGSDNLAFSVVGGTSSGSNRNIFFTAGSDPAAKGGTVISQAEVNIENVTGAINQVTPNASTVSAFVNLGATAAAGWATSGAEASLNSNLKITDSAAPGTALNFYSELTSNSGSALTKGTVTRFAGTWSFSGGNLSYNVSSVPLPAPVLLLLSGLGLMGVVARRGKSAAGDSMMNGAAA